MGFRNHLRKLLSRRGSGTPESASTTSAPTQDTAQGMEFFRLPAEIRTQIYDLALYPELPELTISNCDLPEHLAGSVLNPAVFRVSRQIRAETLSYLCRTKKMRAVFIGTANIFLGIVDAAICDLIDFTLMQPENGLELASKAKVDLFFRLLLEAKGLKKLTLVGLGSLDSTSKVGAHWDAMRRGVEELTGRGVTVVNQ